MAAEIVAFAGPSLPPDAATRWPNIRFLPPAQAGDALALLARPPRIAALIDGAFDAVGAVRHKELLLLAAAGTTLIGAASMGALRAAELHGLGMIGIGRVFRAYRAGRLVGDDEVALVHAPAELGYRPLTVAMVDLRGALSEGRRRGWWSGSPALAARHALHAIHFADRDAATVSAVAATHGLDGDALLALLDEPGVAPKRDDAERCLDACLMPLDHPVTSPPPMTCFTHDLAASRGIMLPARRAASARRRP